MAIAAGKSVVTPTRRLTARHGEEIPRGRSVRGALCVIEAAVGGGIPNHSNP